MRLRWTERSLEDVISIGRYVARQDRQAARRLVGRIRSGVRRLVEHPFSGRIVPEFERPELRELIDGNYRIIYRVDGEDVLILSVFESHRLFPLEPE